MASGFGSDGKDKLKETETEGTAERRKESEKRDGRKESLERAN